MVLGYFAKPQGILKIRALEAQARSRPVFHKWPSPKALHSIKPTHKNCLENGAGVKLLPCTCGSKLTHGSICPGTRELYEKPKPRYPCAFQSLPYREEEKFYRGK
jgi:hypothetical protein